MRTLTFLQSIGFLILCTIPCRADVEVSISNKPTIGGLKGIHVNKDATDPSPAGIAFDQEGNTLWGLGLDATGGYPGDPDLVLAYSRLCNADMLRMRADDGRTELGPRVGHSVLPFQLNLTAGTSQAPLGGLSVGTFGWQYSIYLYQRSNTSLRTNLNFGNLFAWGTDSTNTGTPDFWLHNYLSNSNPLAITANNLIQINGTLSHTGSAAGFFGVAPVARPAVTGSWSDGSAAKSILAALVSLGLVTDSTTP